MRLDVFMVLNGLTESRNKAAALIVGGGVSVNGSRIVKPSHTVSENDKVEVIADQKVYVARSAKKLLTAIERFGIDFKGKVAVDLGASTGGFCEVMLENGVKRVYAVDIGTNQLHPKIKADSRVVNKEHTNARFVTRLSFDEDIDIVTCDLSFISLKRIISPVFCTLKENGEFICLVKPQFEAGPENVGKNGVVKDKKIHLNVVLDIIDLSGQVGFSVEDVCFSGIEGESGNREFLLYLRKQKNKSYLSYEYIKEKISGDQI